MPNVNAVLAQEITRLAKRVFKSTASTTKKLVTGHRRDLAALKRQVAQLTKTVSFLEKQEKKRSTDLPQVDASDAMRFRRDGLKTHRAKLGLSADNYGKLAGVSGLSIYAWEAGRSKPRQLQVAKLATVRGIGKREAKERLHLLGVAGELRSRTRYTQTAEEFVTSLVKSKKTLTSAQINDAWKKSGRLSNADNTLSRMVSLKTLARTKLEGQRGSTYSL